MDEARHLLVGHPQIFPPEYGQLYRPRITPCWVCELVGVGGPHLVRVLAWLPVVGVVEVWILVGVVGVVGFVVGLTLTLVRAV